MATFTNQATITYNGLTVNSNIVTGEITQVLSAEKRATVDTYRADDVLTYVVNIQNSGTTDFNGVILTDNLGEYTFGDGTRVPLTYTGDPVLYSINGRFQPTPAVTAGPPLVISGINVPAGESAEIIYRARLNEFAPIDADATIDNTATVSGAGITEPITATETVTAELSPDLTILKSLTPATVAENGQISYTLTIQNTGAAATVPADNLVITDTFNPILNEPITVTLDGAVLTPDGNYTYDGTTGEFATLPGIVTVPAATYTQDATTGAVSVTPGIATIIITGTI